MNSDGVGAATIHPSIRATPPRGGAEKDAALRPGLYLEAMQAMIEGDFATARVLLRDFVDATIGFPTLAARSANDRNTVQFGTSRENASEIVPTKTRLTAQVPSRLNQLCDTNFSPR
jgi:hypothetical protein